MKLLWLPQWQPNGACSVLLEQEVVVAALPMATMLLSFPLALAPIMPDCGRKVGHVKNTEAATELVENCSTTSGLPPP